MANTGIFISGSGTEVGKTFIACQLIKLLKPKRTVRVRKPIESACDNINGELLAKDAMLLSEACGNNEPLSVVCPFRFEACVSAEKASEDDGVNLTLSDLKNACAPPTDDDFMLIEGAGGWYSPIAQQALNSDLAALLKLPVVLVVKDELGAVNQALLCIDALKKQNLQIAAIVLNQIIPNNLANAKAIRNYTDVHIVVFSMDNQAEFCKQMLLLI